MEKSFEVTHVKIYLTTILLLLDLRRILYITAFSLLDSDRTLCGGNTSTPGCRRSESKQDASEA